MKETEQEKYQNDENDSWNELDFYEGKNLENFNSDDQDRESERDVSSKSKSKVKKAQ